jgi:oleandomycin transport system permease protein
VLFLDEPTTGLDPRSRGDVWNLVRGLVADGTTVLLTSQYLEEADRLATEVAVLEHGRVIAAGTPAALKSRVGGQRLDVRPSGPYLQYVLPGIAVQALLFGSLGTALAITTDRNQGIFDRFRSLPIARSAPLFGHVLGDVLKSLVSLLLVFGFGAALGFRTHAGWLPVLGGFALIVLFSLAMCWVAALIGMASTTVGTVQAIGTVVIIPLTFGSNVFVPTGKLPGWLQAWVKINPVTQLSDAVRGLMLHQPSGQALVASLAWALGILVVCAPAAVLMFRRTGR